MLPTSTETTAIFLCSLVMFHLGQLPLELLNRQEAPKPAAPIQKVYTA